MPRRPPSSGRKRKASEDMTDDPPPPKKQRYNLRQRPPKDTTVWVNDDTLSDSDESEFEDEDEEMVIVLKDDEANDFLSQIFAGQFSRGTASPSKKKHPKKNGEEDIPIELSHDEKLYYKSLAPAQRRSMLESMKRVSTLVNNEGGVPFKFKILQLPVSDYMKSLVLKKLDALDEMSMDSGGAYKLKTWVDGFLKIPFGKSVPLPIKMEDGIQKCTEFMVQSRKDMDKHIYGMNGAKTQIMQVISQWVVNPGSVGNVIALQGPMGVGKTSFARNAIAQVLQRPFVVFTLGGASDIANFVGHSYTYEGSGWGRIADSLMQSGSMNPVMYFDELDKVSATAHGEEIISMLIHLTDRSQNTEFHDRYFAGIDFDMSQCLFVFSFNDIEKVHPILRDRMTIIECGGYAEKDKQEILKNHLWPQILSQLKFTADQVTLGDDAIKFLIDEYSKTESGVRNLIRAVESMMTRLNMLRVSQHESMKEYPFYMEVAFPLQITKKVVQTLMKDGAKIKQEETWRTMYT